MSTLDDFTTVRPQLFADRLYKYIERTISPHPRKFGVILAFFFWFTASLVFPRNVLPGPIETVSATIILFQQGIVLKHLVPTLTRMFLGFVGSLIVAIIIGGLMGISDFSRKFFNPYVVAGLSIPAIAWAAITVIIFGFSIISPVSATILTVSPFLIINIWKGVENIDASLIEMARAFDTSNWRILYRIVARDIAPELFTAVRFGLAMSWKIVTIAELFGSSAGVGYKLVETYELYRFEEAWAWAFLLMLVILLIEYALLRPLHSRIFDYRLESDSTVL